MTVKAIRRHLASALMLVAGVLLCAAASVAQTAAQSPDSATFTDEELSVGRVGGKWNISFIVDWEQETATSAPVVVTGLIYSSGRGEHLGYAKLKQVRLKNRRGVAAGSVSLRWTLIKPDDPKEILLEGAMPPFDAEVPAGGSLMTDIPHILVNRIVTPILKDGELNGAYRLTVGVEEILFADGSAWRRAAAPRR